MRVPSPLLHAMRRYDGTVVSAALRTTPSTASSKGHAQHAVVRQMVKAAGQRQHWRDAIVMFDAMQAEVKDGATGLLIILLQ